MNFQARSNTMSMPYRVQRIEEFVKQLEVGDLKLRVRVLEVRYLFAYLLNVFLFRSFYNHWIFQIHQSERAARKATIMQWATVYTVMGGTLLNIGVTVSTQGSQMIANGSFVAAGNQLTILCELLSCCNLISI